MSCDVGKTLLILQAFRHFTYVTTQSPTLPSLYLRHNSFSNPSLASPTSHALHLRHLASRTCSSSNLFRQFTNVTAHSQSLLSLYLRHSSFSNLSVTHLSHNSFSNPSVALPTSKLVLQPFRRFTYVTAHSPTLPLLHLHHSSFSNPSSASPTHTHTSLTLPGEPPVLILQCFQSLHLRHSLFSKSSVALPTSQLILQPFCCFT